MWNRKCGRGEQMLKSFIIVLNGKKIRNYSIVILTAFVTAWFIYVQNTSISIFHHFAEPVALYKGKKGVALTFNIAWGDKQADVMIDQLIKHEVKASTFFLSGSWAERHPNLVKKISEAGFEIGLLGYNYVDYEELEDSQIRRDIRQAEEVFKKLNIKTEKILRAPTGHFDKRLIEIADSMGYTVVHWSINTNDWKNPGVETIIENVNPVKNGDIILLHASDSARQTPIALPEILKILEDKKLQLVTVTDMLLEGDAQTEEIH